MPRLLEIQVECYAGHRCDESPRRLWLDGRGVDVLEVVDRWLAPDHRYFKLRTDEGIFIVRNDAASGRWELTSFRRPDAAVRNPDGSSA